MPSLFACKDGKCHTIHALSVTGLTADSITIALVNDVMMMMMMMTTNRLDVAAAVTYPCANSAL